MRLTVLTNAVLKTNNIFRPVSVQTTACLTWERFSLNGRGLFFPFSPPIKRISFKTGSNPTNDYTLERCNSLAWRSKQRGKESRSKSQGACLSILRILEYGVKQLSNRIIQRRGEMQQQESNGSGGHHWIKAHYMKDFIVIRLQNRKVRRWTPKPTHSNAHAQQCLWIKCANQCPEGTATQQNF